MRYALALAMAVVAVLMVAPVLVFLAATALGGAAPSDSQGGAALALMCLATIPGTFAAILWDEASKRD